jgi:hypothetical protein
MKFITLISSLILLSGCVHQPQIPQNQSPAKISIERPEDNGFINICPCTVKLNIGQKIVLSGGQTNSFSVKSGTYFLKVSSLNPYPDATKDSDWKSNPLKITITNSQAIKIIVEPKSEGSAYVGGWTLTVKNP